jgi:hypothetical protein
MDYICTLLPEVTLHPKTDGNHVVFPNLNRQAHPFYLTDLDLETGEAKELINSSNPFYYVVSLTLLLM